MMQSTRCPLRWALLADDVTGACDAGVQFSGRGFFSVLLLDAGVPEADEADLLILSSHSRNDPPEVVWEKVAGLSRQLREANRTLVFMKIDSTLRGDLGTGIRAAMAAWEASLAVVAPAFPAQGRTLEEGWLRGAACSALPAVHLPTLLREQGVVKVLHCNHSVFREGLPGLKERFHRFACHESQVVVVDAATQDHLLLAVQAVADLEPPPLMVGSAGLATEVAGVLATAHGREKRMESCAPTVGLEARPVLVLVGSRHPVTVSQLEYLVSHRPASCVVLRDCSSKIVREALENQLHLVVVVDPREDEGRVFELGSQACDLSCGGFVFSGGDTARLICKALGVKGIKLENEVVPGLPWGRILGGPATGFPVATKAGGFGGKGALAAAVDFLSVCGYAEKEDGRIANLSN